MKNIIFASLAAILGVAPFLLAVSTGVTAEATMVGLTTIIAWAAISMIVVEMRRPRWGARLDKRVSGFGELRWVRPVAMSSVIRQAA